MDDRVKHNVHLFVKMAAEDKQEDEREGGIEVAEPKHPLLRPYSATAGRLPGSLLTTLLMQDPRIPFRKWTPERIKEHQDVAKQYEKEYGLDESDIMLSLGSARPLKNLKRVWKRKDLSLPGKLLGTLASPSSDLVTSLERMPNYNPYAHTATIFDPETRIERHELGHATDFEGRRFKLPYSLAYSSVPLFKLYPEHLANKIAEESLDDEATEEEKENLRSMLRRSFGSYMGGAPAAHVNKALTLPAAIVGSALNRAAGKQTFEMSDEEKEKLKARIKERQESRKNKSRAKHLLGLA